MNFRSNNTCGVEESCGSSSALPVREPGRRERILGVQAGFSTTVSRTLMLILAFGAFTFSGCATMPWSQPIAPAAWPNTTAGYSPTAPVATATAVRQDGTAGTQNRTGNQPQVVGGTFLPGTVQSNSQPSTPQTGNRVLRAQSSDGGANQAPFNAQSDQDGNVERTAYQYPELQTAPPGSIYQPANQDPLNYPSPNTGGPNELNPLVRPAPPSGVATFPMNYADLDIYVTETQTGRINIGGAYNSDNGLVGQFIIDERNFDITRFPRSFGELFDGTAWRGAGQTFRLELVPGRQVQRYLVSFSEPYLFNTNVSFSASGYLFDRRYFDWDEQRLGGRLAFGYRLTPDLSLSTGLRMENVELKNPRVNTSPELNANLGNTDLFLGHVSLVRDTRDHPFLATEGSYTSTTFSQGFGEVNFSRADIDYRRYMLMYERPDGSGRHTVSMGTKLGFSGSETPIFENYFVGGFSTMRGFDFRGASPVEGGVRVGGRFQWLNTIEYMFPLTADDMIKGVMFCDFGTVERNIEINSDNFRVAPGFGFRVHMPAAGIGAPLAFDFAFPVAKAATDEEQVFSFYLGVLR